MRTQVINHKLHICRPAQVSSRHGPVTDCRPEPNCIVTDIPKRAYEAYAMQLIF